ncbi:MAG TPA: hypothetical protein PLP50_13045 [Thermoanaerobaculia bacterium]|nr:hypothetical protein [Thermoanaerobaculia bacterium]
MPAVDSERSRVLILSFHAARAIPGKTVAGLFDEDVLFKKHASLRGLLEQDAMDEHIAPESIVNDDEHGGVEKVEHDGASAWTLSAVTRRVWDRVGYSNPSTHESDFSMWFQSLWTQPIDCLVIAGHHGWAKEVGPFFWGSEQPKRGGDHRPYTSIDVHPEDDAPAIGVSGYSYSSSRLRERIRPFLVMHALSRCSLLVIMGCNGVPAPADTLRMGTAWQDWVRSANPQNERPIVLGWWAKHQMPRNTRKGENPEHFSEDFWTRMKGLAGGLQGPRPLQTLCRTKPKAVIEAWAASMKGAFGASKTGQRHLWFETGKGVGAIDPDGAVWRVTRPEGPIEKDKSS